MAYRVYDSTLLDFQLAPSMVGSVAGAANTQGPVIVSKSKVADALKPYVDEKTLAAIPERFYPIALRWRASPGLGLPYTPFRIYKRSKKPAFAEKQVFVFNWGSNATFLNGPLWQVSFTLVNASPIPLFVSVSPLDQHQKTIPNLQFSQTIAANSAVNVRFKFPNINGLVFNSGNATLQNITGIPMQDFLNDPGWQLIETVGFPFKNGTPASAAYQNSLQGFPAAPVSGDQAAVNRLAIARIFYQNPVYTQPDATVLPDWKTPDPSDLVHSFLKTQQTLDNVTTGVLYDIEEMLARVHQNPSLYNGKQANYLKKYKTKGFSDDGTVTSDNAEIQNPVCGTTLLGVSTDTWNAVGLGFGTTDFGMPGSSQDPKFIAGNAEYNIDSDYLLTATFLIPQYKLVQDSNGLFIPKFDKFTKVEMATLAHSAGPLPAMAGISNEVYAENRPLQLDAAFSDDVKLYWQKPAAGIPTGYAVAIRDTLTGQLDYLNTDRPFLPGYNRPYIPASRADENAEDLPGSDSDNFHRFFHHRSPRPESGIAVKNYYIAAMDVFGRWSAFQKTISNIGAAPLVNADIISAKVTVNTSGFDENSAHVYPNCTLEMVVAWHWDDRSPKEVKIAGHFVAVPPPPATIDPNLITKTDGLTFNNTSATVTNISLSFTGTAVSATSSNAAVSVSAIQDTVNSAPPNTIAYKVKIDHLLLNFETLSKLGLGIYVKSSQKNPPSVFTPYGNVKVIYINDPLPRKAPPIQPNVNWSSLPDAANVSRFRVSFAPPTPLGNTVGYAIYRASEAEVRRKVGLPPVQTGQDILARNIDLQGLNASQRKIAKDVFIRINTKMLTAPQTDIDLPGDLEGMYIYAMTSFTDQRVESGFSDWLYVAVPQRYTPAAPALKVLVHKDRDPDNPGTILQQRVVLKVEIPKGVKTERVDLFSTKKEYLAASFDLMGLPVTEGGLTGLPAGWEAFDENDDPVNPVNLSSQVAYYNITQVVTASWFPLFYRAASFGTDKDTEGKYPGRSKSSNLATALLSPPADFQLKNGSLTLNTPSLLRIGFFTDAEIQQTPLGSFKLTIQKRDAAKNIYEDVFAKDVPLIAKKQGGDVATLSTAYRLAKDGTGCFEFEYFVAAEAEAWYKVFVTDPLGRRKSLDLYYKKPAGPKVVIKNLKIKKLLLSVEMAFSIKTAKPAPGAYLLEILASQTSVLLPGGNIHTLAPMRINKRAKTALLFSAKLDAIGTAIPATNPAVYKDAGIPLDGFYNYHAIFKGTNTVKTLNGATVTVRVTDTDGNKTELSAKVQGGIIRPL